MEFISYLLCICAFANIAAAYNIKKALRMGEGIDRDESELLVFANPPGPPKKAALRHHIAHFCPDLEVARQCIRKCMELGKMAFCGKDHVCYCGHRYSDHDINKEVPVEDVYAQFRDLYTKYFGDPTNYPAGIGGESPKY